MTELTQTVETQVEQTPDQLLYKEMRKLLSENPKPPKNVATARFHMVYLHLRGKDWKKAVDVTSAKKVEILSYPFIYNYSLTKYQFEGHLSAEAKKVFLEKSAEIAKEIKDLHKTLL